jgi:AraC family transcriptional regulator
MQPAYASNVHLPGYKYEQAGSAIVAGTQARRWTGYAAELRRHVRTGAEDFVQAVTEVAIAISGRAAIERRGDQKTQKFDALAGTYCICPAGSQVDFLHQESGTVEVLHLFFADLNPPAAPISRTPVGVDWPYRGGLQDPLVSQLGFVMADELRNETPSGDLLLEALTIALVARISHQQRPHLLLQNERAVPRGLDQRRLERVKDFLWSRVESELSLDQIAEQACLSRHHFSRAFKVSTAKTPYQYLRDLRIERAKVLLLQHQVMCR